jgi:hypothetical protein
MRSSSLSSQRTTDVCLWLRGVVLHVQKLWATDRQELRHHGVKSRLFRGARFHHAGGFRWLYRGDEGKNSQQPQVTEEDPNLVCVFLFVKFFNFNLIQSL